MGTLKEKFEELSAGIKASGKPAAAWFPKYTSTSLLNADNWWEALAVCEYALDTREDEKLTEGFFELIFSAFDCNVEVDLSEEEYEFWWEKVMQVCERVAVFSGAGWAQKGAQYSEARYGKRDMSYLFPCYEKAADMGWGEAEATVAYWRYMGFYCAIYQETKDSKPWFYDVKYGLINIYGLKAEKQILKKKRGVQCIQRLKMALTIIV